MNKKIISLLLCSANCMFAAEHQNLNHFDCTIDGEVAYYMSADADIPDEEHLQNEKDIHKLRRFLADLPINEYSAECCEYKPSTSETKVDVKHPHSALREQALAHIQSGKIDAAIAVYDNAIQGPNVTQSDLDHCKNTKIDMIQTYLEKQYRKGIDAANTFLNGNTNYHKLSKAQKTTVLCNVSKKLFESGRSDEAFYAIDRAIKAEPGKYMLHLQLITMLKARNDYEKALIHYEYALHTYPPKATQTFFAYMDMATIYYE